MFAEKRVVIVVAVVLLICALLFWNAASETPTTNTTPTQLSLSVTNSTPAVNQSFTLSGSLTATGTPLSGQTIRLQREDPSGNWQQAVNTTTTDGNGSYTFTRSESLGLYRFEPTFAGGDTYAPAQATVSVTVGNVQKSVISITTTNSAPAVNQSYTVHGSLTDAVTGAPIAGQPLTLYSIAPSGEAVTMHTTTDANGAYSVTRSEPVQGTYDEQASFYGNATYLATSSMIFLTVGNPIPTTIALNVTNDNPAVNQPFTISGHLTDINGTKLPDRAINVNLLLPSGQWNMTAGSLTTDSNGYFSVTYSESTAGQYRFEFHFMGDTTYAQSGPAVEVAVGTLQPTTLSMKASITNPAVNQSFTLSGYLRAANGTPLAGKEIDLGRTVAGQPTHPGDGGVFEARDTDQNGYYSFVLNENARGIYQYMTQFLGDQSYASSYSWMSLTVGTLKSNGTPLPGKTITLQSEDPSGNWNHAVNTTTTDSNGAYTFTVSESAQGTYRFEPTFAGDTYAPAQVTISITVGP